MHIKTLYQNRYHATHKKVNKINLWMIILKRNIEKTENNHNKLVLVRFQVINM